MNCALVVGFSWATSIVSDWNSYHFLDLELELDN